MTTVTIVPEPGNLKTIARELLDLAVKPSDVNYVMWPEPGFEVPEELAARFVAARPDTDVEPEETPQVEQTPAPAEVEEVKPVKRSPGRPKKIQGGQ